MQGHSLAAAKINLHLHITGRADNGYHYLDSLVAFTSMTDDIQIAPADRFQLSITGNDELAATCNTEDNLISRVTRLLAEKIDVQPNVHIKLTKNIPLAGGLGGGSGDAAATLLLLKDLWNISSMNMLEDVAASLGSDIVACLHDKAVVMKETGNVIQAAPQMPLLHGILVNPNVACSTPAVYKAYATSGHPFSEDIIFPDKFETIASLCDFLKQNTHNDLTDAAITVAPVVQTVLDALENLDHVRLARLSGSGATCFAIFETEKNAQDACAFIQKTHPDWWATVTKINC